MGESLSLSFCVAYIDEIVRFMVPVPKDTHRHTCIHISVYTQTKSSKAARLCGAPVCPRHTETDKASLLFTKRLKQQENITWSETHREQEGEREKWTTEQN